MNIWRFRFAVIGALLFVVGPVFAAQMTIDNAIVYFGKGNPDRRDIEVSNTGKGPLYLRVTTYKVENPGSRSQKRVKVTDPRASGLLVTPNKLVVPEGGRKRVRIVNIQKTSPSERVFRILFEPVSGKVESEQTGLKVLIGYEVLVLAQPDELHVNLDARRREGELVFKNTGNTDIYLRNVRQCRTSETNQVGRRCKPLKDKRLYPGNTWRVRLPESWPVHLETVVGDKRTPRVF